MYFHIRNLQPFPHFWGWGGGGLKSGFYGWASLNKKTGQPVHCVAPKTGNVVFSELSKEWKPATQSAKQSNARSMYVSCRELALEEKYPDSEQKLFFTSKIYFQTLYSMYKNINIFFTLAIWLGGDSNSRTQVLDESRGTVAYCWAST
jgi:hypothetical protein